MDGWERLDAVAADLLAPAEDSLDLVGPCCDGEHRGHGDARGVHGHQEVRDGSVADGLPGARGLERFDSASGE